jgi:hypothetical protein
MPVADSLASAHFKMPHTSLRNKVSSSVLMPPNGIKYQPSPPAHHPLDTSGAPTQDIDAILVHYTLMPPPPITMANSLMTSGTNMPTTVNSAGTLQLDA